MNQQQGLKKARLTPDAKGEVALVVWYNKLCTVAQIVKKKKFNSGSGGKE